MAAFPPFRRLASRGPFFRGFPVVWIIQAAVYPHRCVTLHHQVPCHRETTCTQYCRPYDTLSCLFSTAVRLGKCQSILTQTQVSNELDMTCCGISPLGSITCSQVGPVSLEWPVASTGGLDQSSLWLSQEDANGEHLDNAHHVPPHLRWRRDSLQPPRVQRILWSRNTCVHIPDDGHRLNTRGLIGSPASPQLSR